MATKKTSPAAKKAAAKKFPVKKTPVKKPAVKKSAAVAPITVAAKRSPLQAFGRKLAARVRKPAVIVVLLIAVAGAVLWINADNSSASKPVSQEAYKQALQAQVEQPDGTPNTGRDPASQGQNSLAAAASKPAGAGLRTDKPASGASANDGSHASHGDVYGDAKGTGIGTNGCFIDYGIQGEQCLPAHAAGDDKVLNCAEVRKYFKDGVKVTGTDRFHLDHDGDKVACGPGEVSH